MILLLLAAGAALLALGVAIGHYRPAERLSDWAHWNQHDNATGLRRAAIYTILSAENVGWLIAHPIDGFHAWRHHNDPPPTYELAPQIDPNWAAKRAATQATKNGDQPCEH